MTNPSLSGQVPLGGSPPQQPPQPVLPAGRTLPVAMTGAPAPAPVVDPFSKVIDLPSSGLYYATGTRQVTIRPTRGEQEEMIAGTPEESPDRVKAIREVVKQCTNLGQLPFEELLIRDFGTVCMHLFAISAGTDEVNIQAGCDKRDCPMAAKKLALTMLPSVVLRQDGGAGDGPPPEEEDPDIRAARMVEEMLGEVEESAGVEYRSVTAADVEPFRCQLSNGVAVEYRYHRMKDLEAAEEYARATGDQGLLIGAKLGSYLSARQIVSINGERMVGTTQALQWWKATSSPLLRELREDIAARNFGFNMRPEFRCPRGDCRKKVRVKLPNDGSLFRARA